MKKSTQVKLVACFLLGGAFAATASAQAVDSAPATTSITANPPAVHTQAEISTAAGILP
jgi:hypothetical protein